MVDGFIAGAWSYANEWGIGCQDFLGGGIGKPPNGDKSGGTHPFFFSFHQPFQMGGWEIGQEIFFPN